MPYDQESTRLGSGESFRVTYAFQTARARTLGRLPLSTAAISQLEAIVRDAQA